jgi:hypothetical protein
MKSIFITLLFSFVTLFLFGQKYIQIETRNRYKVKRFAIGQTLTFKLKGKEEVWRTQEITDILPEQNIILMDNEIVEIEKIACLRKNRFFVHGAAKQLYKFAAAWLLYGSIDHLVAKTPFTKKDLIVPITSATTGFVLQQAFKYKYTRFGSRIRLRLIDLNFK